MSIPVTVDDHVIFIPESACSSMTSLVQSINDAIAPRAVANVNYADDDGDVIELTSDDDFKLWLELREGRLVAETTDTPGLRSLRKANSLDVEDVLSIDPTTLRYLNSIAVGASGTVYKVLDLKCDRFVAVKAISLDVTEDDHERILEELEILHKCSSPFVIDFFGAFFGEDGRIHICMEFMNGGSLQGKGPIPDPRVLAAVASAAFRGLEHLWSSKILHRDVKPSNLLVDSTGAIKLCDFGVSVCLAASVAKTFVGTSAYMAPERLRGDQYSIKADVWSVGMTLLELTAETSPLRSLQEASARPTTFVQELLKLEQSGVIEGLVSDVVLRDLLKKCLKLDPEDRISLSECLVHTFVTTVCENTRQIVAAWAAQFLTSCCDVIGCRYKHYRFDGCR